MSENTSSEVQFDRKDLKIKALLETTSNLENRVADLRVDLTLHAQEVERWQSECVQLQQKNTELESKVAELEWNNLGDEPEDTVEAEVVQEDEG